MTPYEIHLAHLVKMAKCPALKAHAWHRAQELEACNSGLWTGIAASLAREMAALKAAESSSGLPKSGD